MFHCRGRTSVAKPPLFGPSPYFGGRKKGLRLATRRLIRVVSGARTTWRQVSTARSHRPQNQKNEWSGASLRLLSTYANLLVLSMGRTMAASNDNNERFQRSAREIISLHRGHSALLLGFCRASNIARESTKRRRRHRSAKIAKPVRIGYPTSAIHPLRGFALSSSSRQRETSPLPDIVDCARGVR